MHKIVHMETPTHRFSHPAGLITKKEAAETLSISSATLNRLIAKAVLVPVPIAYRKKPLLFSLEAVRRLLSDDRPGRLVSMKEMRKARR